MESEEGRARGSGSPSLPRAALDQIVLLSLCGGVGLEKLGRPRSCTDRPVESRAEQSVDTCKACPLEPLLRCARRQLQRGSSGCVLTIRRAGRKGRRGELAK